MYKFLEQTAADFLTRDVKTVTRGMSLRELGAKFDADDFNAYPVVENAHIVGIVSKFDYLACFVFTPTHIVPHYDELMKRSVADILTHDFIYVGPETRLTRVLQLMVDHRIRSMPVVEVGQKLVGMISREDVMRALRQCTRSDARP